MDNETSRLPYFCLGLSPYPEDNSFKGDEGHPDMPPVAGADTELQKALELRTHCEAMLDQSDGGLQKDVASYAREIESTRAGMEAGQDGDEDLPLAILEQYGALSYRALRRIQDLHRAFTTIPTFYGSVPVRGNDAFIVALVQVALRRLHIRILKKQLTSAAHEWKRQLERLADCELHLRRFQDLAVFDMPPRFEEGHDAAWRSDALAHYFIPRTMASERLDRLTVRRDGERGLLRVMERAVEFMTCDERERWEEAEPDVRSKAWDRCLGTVRRFCALQGRGDVGVFIKMSLAGAMWRFTYMLWKDWEERSHGELLEEYCREIMRLGRASLSEGDGLWPRRRGKGKATQGQ